MDPDHLKNFEDICRKTGLKITHQRLEIYRELITAKDHPTAEMLHKRLRLRLPTLSIDTVYRTLMTFAQHKLANRVETTEHLNRFEVVLAPHHHLVCRSCHSIVDFTWSALDQAELPLEVVQWGKIENKVVVIYGTCESCGGLQD
jgi:Fur family peroxide stress response transcriptional regulator